MLYFEKSQPSPKCLELEKAKVNGDYKCGEVLEKLQSDFKNKCYICGLKEPTSIDVEHLRPHKGDKNLKFQWENLFWCCTHCNRTKHDKYDDIIDCTDINEDIENRIKIMMKPFPLRFVEIEALDQKQSTISTVKLLKGAFNGSTKFKKLEADNLRNKIFDDIKDFQLNLDVYINDDSKKGDKIKSLENIKKHLKKTSNFTAFKRWIVRENEVMRKNFEEYFD